jgi:hypothetical protein
MRVGRRRVVRMVNSIDLKVLALILVQTQDLFMLQILEIVA